MKFIATITILSAFCLAIGSTQPSPNTTPLTKHSDETFDHRGQKLSLPAEVTFNAHIRGIMSNTCFSCHGPDEETNTSGVRFDTFDVAVEEAGAIEPGDAEASSFYQRMIDEDDPMPPADFLHQLSDYEKALFKKWIDGGAKYEKHWAYAPLRQPAVPELAKFAKLVKNPIDAFVMARLERDGIAPSSTADKTTLLRRLSLDLIGLPPTTQEIAAFVADDSEDAYEKQVDRLLASPHFGERMSAFWLDIVRFSDTVGFHGDQNQRIFPYRDFVIQSLNTNQPFDEFTRDQLAGDLLPNPTNDQLTATGLIRLNMVTREGGAQPEEYLAKYTADRVRMLGTAWLGATTGCCECHNHKYDPFSIEDFYALGAYFDDVRQWGVYSDYGYTPNADLKGFNNDYPFPPELRRESKSLNAQLAFLESRLDQEAAKLIDDKTLASDKFKNWLANIAAENSQDLWQIATPETISTAVDEKFELLDDNSVRFSEKPKSNQKTTLNIAFDKSTDIRALRLEVIPDQQNEGHVGRGKGGTFEASLTAKKIEPDRKREKQLVKPRFVRIELDGPEFLSLAEVQVYSKVAGKLKNIALDGHATQSSTHGDGVPSIAIDGKTDGKISDGDRTSHTRRDANAWWEVDLGKEFKIDSVEVWNRTDANVAGRIKGYRLVLLDKDRRRLFETQPAFPKPSTKIDIPREAIFDNALDLEIEYAVANRSNPFNYTSGRPPVYLEKRWRSGPMRWQQPSDETKLDHVAVYALNKTINFKPGDQLSVVVSSKDVGRIRLSTSPLARPVAGRAAANKAFVEALESLNTSSLKGTISFHGEPVGSGSVSLTPANSIDSKPFSISTSVDSDGNFQFLNFSKLESTQQTAIKSAYYQFITPFDKQSRKVAKLRKEIAECRSGMAMTLISQPVTADKKRRSRVLPRGNWQDKSGREIEPNTPHFLPGHQSHDSADKKLQTRLDLANWITSPSNPLTPRHYVNRVWAQFFGTGLSNVIDDLGNQGEWPSHPQLLDWLASEFQSNWDRKQIIRLIVTSYTYRQQAATNPKIKSIDPYNRLLAQQAARRLEAEIVRDNALAISGLLNTD
jgi:hypothetical protein